MNIYIVTPTWNCKDELSVCASSLIQHTHISMTWVIVENGSELEHRRAIEETVFSLTGLIRRFYIRNEKNLGIPVAQNQALNAIASQDDGPYSVIMLDADTEVTHGWLECFLAYHDLHPNVGLIGGARSPGGTGLPVYFHKGGWWYQHDDMAGASEFYPAECVDFAAVLFTWQILERGIRFDENYHIYDGHDQDLSFRVRSWGFDIRQIEANVLHRPSTIMKDRNYQWAGGGRKEWDELRRRNVARFAQIWAPFLAPQRRTIEEEMAHMERMNRKLAKEADWRKEVPA